MSEKRFTSGYSDYLKNARTLIKMDNERLTYGEIVDLLNENQELIEELHSSDHMGWGRAEKFEKELKQKKIYIKRLEYKVQKFKEENEQLKQQLKTKHIVNKQYEELQRLKKDNTELKKENKKLEEEWEFSFRTEMAHHRVAEKELKEKIREKQATIEGLKEKLCELGVSDVKINGKRIDIGLEEWLE